MSNYECIKISKPDEGLLEKLFEELTRLGLVEDKDFVLVCISDDEYLLDFIPEAAEIVKSKIMTENYAELSKVLK